MVEPDAVLLTVLPAIGANGIERCGELAQRFSQDTGLFSRRPEQQTHRSVHIASIPYASGFCKGKEDAASPVA